MKRFEVDLESLENAKYGVKVIAFTDDPAIVIKGIALSKQVEKKVMFSDATKMQVVAPLLIPMDVYRYDDEDGDYEIVFTGEAVERITKQMMKNLPKSGLDSIFTNEHTTEQLDAYIFELMFVDSKEKQTLLKSAYGLDIPLMGSVVTVQCSDKKTYDYIIKNGKVGLSIDGVFKLNNINNVKMSKAKKKITLSKKLKFRKGYFKQKGGSVKLEAIEIEELEAGQEVTVYDEDGVVEDWTGEITVMVDDAEAIITVEDGEIAKVETEEVEETVTEETEMADEEEVTETVTETTPGATVDLEPLLEKLTAIEAMLAEVLAKDIQDEEESEGVQMSRADIHRKGLSKLVNRKR